MTSRSMPPDHVQQSLKCRSIENRSGVALIVETFCNQLVAQRAQSLNVSPTQIELDLAGRQIVMRLHRLASVDGAANRRSAGCHKWSVAQNTSSIGDLLARRTPAVNQGPDSEIREPRRTTLLTAPGRSPALGRIHSGRRENRGNQTGSPSFDT